MAVSDRKANIEECHGNMEKAGAPNDGFFLNAF